MHTKFNVFKIIVSSIINYCHIKISLEKKIFYLVIDNERSIGHI